MIKLTNEERDKLILYNSRVKELLDCKFLKMKKFVLIPTGGKPEKFFTLKIDDEEPNIDQIKSMLVSFRPFYMPNEKINFGHICDILYQKLESNKLKDQVGCLHKTYNNILKKGPGFGFRIKKESVIKKVHPKKDIIESWLNSIFHSDIKHMKKVDYYKRIGSDFSEFYFLSTIIILIKVIAELNKIIKMVLKDIN